jgi:AraC-like DNA-binding protein
MVFSNAIAEQRNFRYLDRIQTAVEQLSQTVGRTTAEKRTFKSKTLDLEQFCCNLIAEIQAIATCVEKQTTLKHRIELQPISSGAAQSTTSHSIFPSNSQLNEVFHFIEANYREPITLSDVAEAVGYSPAYLTDLVRRQTGQTVNRWIVQRRMAEARSLLLETERSIEQIAEAVGYCYVGHFFRQFRQYHGTTPNAWRTTQRKKLYSSFSDVVT